ncbi:MAG: ABC-2 family transporter protein [Oscillospiraceae bacterium]|nr:ABC-2 family transporter protein [Oscillospiraceae bacterium]
MKLYMKYVFLLLKSQMQYMSSFIMMVISQFFTPFALLAGIYFLFERFGSIGGYSMFEVFLCYSIIGMCFSIATCFARGFDVFANMIRTGSFDRILVRPRSTVLQILGGNLDLKRVGHFIHSILLLVIAIMQAPIDWSITKGIVLFNMIVSGTLIFSAVYLLQATAAFWTTEALEVANIFTHGIKEHASYPLDIFPKWITVFFTFIIPFGTVNYLPLEFILDRTEGSPLIYLLIPFAGGLFILPCLMFWQFGIKKYTSTGS